jgi:hypothetical protein
MTLIDTPGLRPRAADAYQNLKVCYQNLKVCCHNLKACYRAACTRISRCWSMALHSASSPSDSNHSQMRKPPMIIA